MPLAATHAWQARKPTAPKPWAANRLMNAPFITLSNSASLLCWADAVSALRTGHQLPEAAISDSFLGPGKETLLTRSAYVEGLGYGVKAVTVIDENRHRGIATVQGAMMVYAEHTGELRAIIDSALITRIKTVSDSLLGAQLLARKDSKRLLVVGAGAIAQSLAEAYPKVFPEIDELVIWARRREQAEQLIGKLARSQVTYRAATELADEVPQADIISAATLARDPVIRGQWVSPGTHVDLIGAYKADMREGDDQLMRSAKLYVDAKASTIEHIGEIQIPILNGVISESDIRGDLYDLLAKENTIVRHAHDITVYKNGGGAHLDLMIADYIVKSYEAATL